MIDSWRRCEKCNTPKVGPTESVEDRGPGWKCLRCGWWNWLPEATPSPRRDATYYDEHGLSSVYVYVTPRDEFPEPNDLVSVERETQITVDYERSTGKMLGIEVITTTDPTYWRPDRVQSSPEPHGRG